MKDATGRDLKKGSLVEIQLIGMYKAIVVDVIEPSRLHLMNPEQQSPPTVVLQLMMQWAADTITEAGQAQSSRVYLVREPTPDELQHMRDEGVIKGGTDEDDVKAFGPLSPGPKRVQ